ncbi:hypothetical protein [Anaerotruncus rubiinfantis]|uniref:hypothetical protein n=1 Tax=Anaerotruncus rubiinfantis TaxID=1720200 RepID=UPI000830224E|nr:hypothetical protein [Anaerotruncus rubiinfantis]
MEFRHQMMRLAVGSAIDRAIPNMKKDTYRGIRNLVDLGAALAASTRQKEFCEMVRKNVRNPKSPYNAMLLRVIREVDEKIVRLLGVNLGYTCFTYGSAQLTQSSRKYHAALPWLISFEGPCGSASLAPVLQNCRNLGIYIYRFCPDSAQAISGLCALAAQFPESTFLLEADGALITEAVAEQFSQAPNVIAVLLSGGGLLAASDRLHDKKLLFGYAENELPAFMREAARAEAIAHGSLFAAYTGDTPPPVPERFFQKEKSPLLLIDWQRDIKALGMLMNGGCGYLQLTPRQGLSTEGMVRLCQ